MLSPNPAVSQLESRISSRRNRLQHQHEHDLETTRSAITEAFSRQKSKRYVRFVTL